MDNYGGLGGYFLVEGVALCVAGWRLGANAQGSWTRRGRCDFEEWNVAAESPRRHRLGADSGERRKFSVMRDCPNAMMVEWLSQ